MTVNSYISADLWRLARGPYVVKNALIAVFLVILVFLNISKLHDLLSLPHNNRK